MTLLFIRGFFFVITIVIGAYIGAEKVATGEGRSKQEAEQDAAQKALTAKGW